MDAILIDIQALRLDIGKIVLSDGHRMRKTSIVILHSSIASPPSITCTSSFSGVIFVCNTSIAEENKKKN